MSNGREAYEKEWKDYYLILGIDRNATQDEIKKAYRLIAKEKFPDKVEETFKKSATEEAKKINEAYSYLRDPKERDRYNLKWDEIYQYEAGKETASQDRTKKPEVFIDPAYIYINDAEAGKIIKTSFIIRDKSGHFNGEINVNSDAWIKIADQYSLDPNYRLPYKIDIEIIVTEWNKIYHGKVIITLDNEVIPVQVLLKTKSRPGKSQPVNLSRAKGNSIWHKPYSVFAFIILLLVIYLFISNNTFHIGEYVDWQVRGQDAQDSVNRKASTQPLLEKSEESVGSEIWNKTYRIGSWSKSNSIQQTTDGGYIIVGYGDADRPAHGSNATAVVLIKTDSNGNELWNRLLDAPSYDYNVGYSVQQTEDGEYIIAGVSKRSSPEWQEDAWLMKIDAKGRQIWFKIFNESSLESFSQIQKIDDNGFIVCGSTYRKVPIHENNQVFYMPNQVGWLLKFDADGKKIWERTFNDIRFWEDARMQQTSDGGFILNGLPADTRGISLAKVDLNGNELWNRSYKSDKDLEQNFYSVEQTSDGGYILVGCRDRGTDQDVLLIKTDSSGNKIWERTFKGAGYSIGTSVHQTGDGGYIIIGNTRPNYNDENNDLWLIKTDAYGRELWNKSYGGRNWDFGGFSLPTSDGCYVTTGHSGSYDARGYYQAWLIKIKVA